MIINPYDKRAMRAAHLYCHDDGDKAVGLTSGTFDLFHDYHLRYLERCRRLCDVLVVGVDSDASVRKVKGPDRPILSEFQRLILMDANKYVTFCYIQDSLEAFAKVAEALYARKGKYISQRGFFG
jgi:cytidyltransferase-like protein